MQKLELKPRDVVVVKTKYILAMPQRERLTRLLEDTINNHLRIGNIKVIVIEDIDIGVIRKSEEGQQ